jgi:hypothetical protein
LHLLRPMETFINILYIMCSSSPQLHQFSQLSASLQYTVRIGLLKIYKIPSYLVGAGDHKTTEDRNIPTARRCDPRYALYGSELALVC